MEEGCAQRARENPTVSLIKEISVENIQKSRNLDVSAISILKRIFIDRACFARKCIKSIVGLPWQHYHEILSFQMLFNPSTEDLVPHIGESASEPFSHLSRCPQSLYHNHLSRLHKRFVTSNGVAGETSHSESAPRNRQKSTCSKLLAGIQLNIESNDSIQHSHTIIALGEQPTRGVKRTLALLALH
jgi:hypothetical protein